MYSEGCLDCFSVGGFDLAAGFGSAERPEKRDGLGGLEGEIEAGDRAVCRDAAHPEQRLAVDRVVAGEHCFELVSLDLSLRPSSPSPM